MADLSDVREQAKRFAEQSELLHATAEVASDRSAWEEANRDPAAFLRKRGIHIPDELTLRPIPMRGFGKPAPDWEPFTLTLTNCRTIVVIDDDGKKDTEEVCFGWQIVPNSIPGGPIG